MPAKLMAVLGVCRRKGRWEVSQRTSALVLFGHCHIDFREAFADPEIESMKLNVTCLFGNATFLMPEGVDIRPSVVSVLASTGFDVPNDDVEAALPTIAMETTTLFGRCRIRIEKDEVDVASEIIEVGDADVAPLEPPPLSDDQLTPDPEAVPPVVTEGERIRLTSFDNAA